MQWLHLLLAASSWGCSCTALPTRNPNKKQPTKTRSEEKTIPPPPPPPLIASFSFFIPDPLHSSSLRLSPAPSPRLVDTVPHPPHRATAAFRVPLFQIATLPPPHSLPCSCRHTAYLCPHPAPGKHPPSPTTRQWKSYKSTQRRLLPTPPTPQTWPWSQRTDSARTTLAPFQTSHRPAHSQITV